MNSSDTYIVFQLANFSYAVKSSDVLHIDMLEHVTPVPNAHSAVDGVVFSRGNVIPALNLRVRFGLPRQPYSGATRLVFLKLQQRTVALIVDAAREFRRIPESAVKPVTDTLQGLRGNYIKGVATLGERTVLLLDIAAVLTLEETAALAALEVPATQTS